jgi:DNA-binding NtrC family response regulator
MTRTFSVLYLEDAVPIVGRSPAMRTVNQAVLRAAGRREAVLIQGERGSGREQVARGIHRASDRRRGPFVMLDCSALPDTLLEMELFGIARETKPAREGLVEGASGGTLFLKEIGGLGIDLQGKLLHLVRDSEMRRVGDSQTIRTDIRLVVATASDLSLRVRADRFLPDLYDRLRAVPIDLPPLRDRKEDIPLLADHFIRKFNALSNKTVSDASREALERLRGHDWPGNVRELRNALERAFLATEAPAIRVEDLPPPLRRNAGSSEAPPVDALAARRNV